MERRITAAEASWPTHELDVSMTTVPTYQLQRATETDNAQNEAADWRRRYMAEDVVQLQLLKQHHYTILTMKLPKVASHWQAAKRVIGQGCVRVIFPARNGCVRNLLYYVLAS